MQHRSPRVIESRLAAHENSPLNDFLKKINHSHHNEVIHDIEEIRQTNEKFVVAAMERGRVFSKMKEILNHGEFEALCLYIGEHPRTIQYSMRFAKFLYEDRKFVCSYSYRFLIQLTADSVPEAARKRLLDDLRAGLKIPQKVAVERIRAAKEEKLSPGALDAAAMPPGGPITGFTQSESSGDENASDESRLQRASSSVTGSEVLPNLPIECSAAPLDSSEIETPSNDLGPLSTEMTSGTNAPGTSSEISIIPVREEEVLSQTSEPEDPPVVSDPTLVQKAPTGIDGFGASPNGLSVPTTEETIARTNAPKSIGGASSMPLGLNSSQDIRSMLEAQEGFGGTDAAEGSADVSEIPAAKSLLAVAEAAPGTTTIEALPDFSPVPTSEAPFVSAACRVAEMLMDHFPHDQFGLLAGQLPDADPGELKQCLLKLCDTSAP